MQMKVEPTNIVSSSVNPNSSGFRGKTFVRLAAVEILHQSFLNKSEKLEAIHSFLYAFKVPLNQGASSWGRFHHDCTGRGETKAQVVPPTLRGNIS